MVAVGLIVVAIDVDIAATRADDFCSVIVSLAVTTARVLIISLGRL